MTIINEGFCLPTSVTQNHRQNIRLNIVNTLVLFLLACLIPQVKALPNGSPLCEAEAEKVSGCMGGDNNPALEFKVECGDCLVKPGEKLKFKITSKVESYKGLLIYVQGATPKDRVGEFVIDGKVFKDNEKRCKRFTYQKGSVITHVNNSAKSADTVFEWTAPKECPASTELHAAFIYNRLSNWMVINPVKINCGAGKSDPPEGTDPPLTPPPPPPVNVPEAPAPPSESIPTLSPSFYGNSIVLISHIHTNATSHRPKRNKYYKKL